MPMTAYIAIGLIVFVSLAHSYLGEKYILALMMKAQLPRLFRDETDAFTKQVLRFAWHLTSLAWMGLGYIVWIAPTPEIFHAVGTIFLVHVPFPFLWTRGRHLSWVIFLAIGVLLWI